MIERWNGTLAHQHHTQSPLCYHVALPAGQHRGTAVLFFFLPEKSRTYIRPGWYITVTRIAIRNIPGIVVATTIIIYIFINYIIGLVHELVRVHYIRMLGYNTYTQLCFHY